MESSIAVESSISSTSSTPSAESVDTTISVSSTEAPTSSISSWISKFWPPQNKWIWIGVGVGVLLLIIGFIWWRRRRNASSSDTHDEEHDHHHHSPDKRVVNEHNFNIGKEKLKGTLGIMDKAIDNLRKTIEELQTTTDSSAQKELKDEVQFHHDFLKKMNDQAIRFRGLLLDDAKTLNSYSEAFQKQVDDQVKQASIKLQKGTQLINTISDKPSTTKSPSTTEQPLTKQPEQDPSIEVQPTPEQETQ
jgi:hypothetical protein